MLDKVLLDYTTPPGLRADCEGFHREQSHFLVTLQYNSLNSRIHTVQLCLTSCHPFPSVIPKGLHGTDTAGHDSEVRKDFCKLPSKPLTTGLAMHSTDHYSVVPHLQPDHRTPTRHTVCLLQVTAAGQGQTHSPEAHVRTDLSLIAMRKEKADVPSGGLCGCLESRGQITSSQDVLSLSHALTNRLHCPADETGHHGSAATKTSEAPFNPFPLFPQFPGNHWEPEKHVKYNLTLASKL